MENFITNTTKLIEKFVSNVQNHTFASKFKDKVIVFNDHQEAFVKNVILFYGRAVKYSYGKIRVRNFLINNLESFEKEHKKIVLLIEGHSLQDNWDEYVRSKSHISAILRANRRMGLMKITDSEDIKSYISQHITRKRFEKGRNLLAT